MGLLYKDGLLDAFGAWAIAYIPYGGPDFGEIAAVAKAVGNGGADAFHDCWVAGQAEAARNPGRIASARELFVRASAFYASSHCEMMNRSLVNRAVLDWLDEVLG